MLAEGSFHEATVEQVGERAGVSRATVYQHFGSRLDLIDSVCDVMGVNPALVEIRNVVDLPDAGEALAKTLANTVRFWSSESGVVRALYGVVEVDPAARAFVDRQTRDRTKELGLLADNLSRSGRLRAGVTKARALVLLLLLTSWGTYRELREAGLSDRRVTSFLQESAERELF
jgi:AcrR family transcriptional regulator